MIPPFIIESNPMEEERERENLNMSCGRKYDEDYLQVHVLDIRSPQTVRRIKYMGSPTELCRDDIGGGLYIMSSYWIEYDILWKDFLVQRGAKDVYV